MCRYLYFKIEFNDVYAYKTERVRDTDLLLVHTGGQILTVA